MAELPEGVDWSDVYFEDGTPRPIEHAGGADDPCDECDARLAAHRALWATWKREDDEREAAEALARAVEAL